MVRTWIYYMEELYVKVYHKESREDLKRHFIEDELSRYSFSALWKLCETYSKVHQRYFHQTTVAAAAVLATGKTRTLPTERWCHAHHHRRRRRRRRQQMKEKKKNPTVILLTIKTCNYIYGLKINIYVSIYEFRLSEKLTSTMRKILKSTRMIVCEKFQRQSLSWIKTC